MALVLELQRCHAYKKPFNSTLLKTTENYIEEKCLMYSPLLDYFYNDVSQNSIYRNLSFLHFSLRVVCTSKGIVSLELTLYYFILICRIFVILYTFNINFLWCPLDTFGMLCLDFLLIFKRSCYILLQEVTEFL